MQDLVSVIIPVYNAEKFLQESLTSVINQSYKNVEIICINDCSTDSSGLILERFQRSNFLIINHTENRGQSSSVNEGLTRAHGKYIKIFDADDVMNPEHIEAQVLRAEGREDILVSSAWGRFFDNNPVSAIFKPESVWRDMEAIDWMKAALSQKYDHMPGWLWLIPKKVIEKAGGYNTELSLNNDFEFSMRLLQHVDEVRFAGNAKLYYRSSVQNSLSSSKSKTAFSAALKSTDMGCAYLLEHENSSSTQRMCANRYQEWAFRAYPDFPEVVKYCEDRIKSFGGSDRKMDGGKMFVLFQFLLGWKKAVRLKGLILSLQDTLLSKNE
jgi:glycosyltransferase involved in cell wall biosynthesis